MEKQFKLFISILIITSLMLSIVIADSSLMNITVEFNGVNISVNGAQINGNNFLYNDTTYVPLREIAEMFGKEVSWIGETNTANIKDATNPVPDSNKNIMAKRSGQGQIAVEFNQINIELNGAKVNADNILFDFTTYVPLRKIAEMLGKDVTWMGSTNTASITDKKAPDGNEQTASYFIHLVSQGKYTTAYNMFDDTMKTALSTEKIGEI